MGGLWKYSGREGKMFFLYKPRYIMYMYQLEYPGSSPVHFKIIMRSYFIYLLFFCCIHKVDVTRLWVDSSKIHPWFGALLITDAIKVNVKESL